MEAEKYYPGSTLSPLEPLGSLKSIDYGHGNIGDEYVGIQSQNRVDGLITIFRCADNLKFLAKHPAIYFLGFTLYCTRNH
jgi:hypothetical protein